MAISAGLAAGLTAVAAAGTSAAVQSAGTATGKKKQYKRQRQLNEQAFEQNQEAIRRQNEYNLPINQVQRYVDAGLNPRLLYTSSADGGNQSSAAQYSPPDAPDIGSSVGQAAGSAIQQRFQIAQMLEGIKGQKLDNERKAIENHYLADQDEMSSINQLTGRIDDTTIRPGLARLKRDRAIQDLLFGSEERVQRNWRHENLDAAQLSLLRSNFQRNIADIELMPSRKANLDASTDFLKAGTGLRGSDKRLKDLELEWFNSSRFIRNLAPFLRLLSR